MRDGNVQGVTDDLIRLSPADAKPRLRAWYDAVRLGFHEARGGDEGFDRWLADTTADDATLWAVADPDNPEGMPVGTLEGFDKTINAGQREIAARLITDVTVRPTHRRRGLLRQMMGTELAETHRRGIPVVALTVTEATIYGRFGFGVSIRGHKIEVDTAERFGLLSSPGSGRVQLVPPAEAIDSVNTVFGRFHQSTRGSVTWPTYYQDMMSGAWDAEAESQDKKTWFVLHRDADDQVDGYAAYRIGERGDGPRTVNVLTMVTTSAQAHLALWEYLASIDLTGVVQYHNAPLNDPLPWAMRDSRGYRVTGQGDRLWTRILDPVACLAARPWRGDGTVVVAIDDPMGFAAGTYRIESSGGAVEVTAVDVSPEVTVPVDVLAGLWLGGANVPRMAAAGRFTGSPEAVQRLATMMDLADPPASVTFF